MDAADFNSFPGIENQFFRHLQRWQPRHSNVSPTPIQGGGSYAVQRLTHANQGRRQPKVDSYCSSSALEPPRIVLAEVTGTRRRSPVPAKPPALPGEPGLIENNVNCLIYRHILILFPPPSFPRCQRQGTPAPQHVNIVKTTYNFPKAALAALTGFGQGRSARQLQEPSNIHHYRHHLSNQQAK